MALLGAAGDRAPGWWEFAVAAAGVRVGVSISPMLPIADPRAFAERIAQSGASGCVTQYLKPPNARFVAGSPAEAIRKLWEDGWSPQRYHQTRAVIAEALGGQGLRLFEGKDGYAPAE